MDRNYRFCVYHINASEMVSLCVCAIYRLVNAISTLFHHDDLLIWNRVMDKQTIGTPEMASQLWKTNPRYPCPSSTDASYVCCYIQSSDGERFYTLDSRLPMCIYHCVHT